MSDPYYSSPVWIVIGLSIVLGLSVGFSKRARAATWTPYVALTLLLVGLWFCRFDGQPRIGTHFDGTWYAWLYCIVARIPMGLALMLLGPLIARAAVDLVGERKAVVAGALASLPLATGLVVAGAIYVNSAVWGPLAFGVSTLPGEHFAGRVVLMVGACLSLLIAMIFVIPIFNRRPLGSPQSF